MTPERFAQLWRHLHGDAPIPDDKAEYVLLDPPSRNRFAHRDTRTAEAKSECEACSLSGYEDTADAADAAEDRAQRADDAYAHDGDTYDDPQGSDDLDREL